MILFLTKCSISDTVTTLEITLSAKDLVSIEKITPPGIASGLRSPEQVMQALNQDTDPILR